MGHKGIMVKILNFSILFFQDGSQSKISRGQWTWTIVVLMKLSLKTEEARAEGRRVK